MPTFYLAISGVLLVTIAAGLVRVSRGPTPADCMLAVQLFGTTGVALMLVLAEAQGQRSLRDVALVFALLAVLASVAFVKRAWHSTRGGEQ